MTPDEYGKLELATIAPTMGEAIASMRAGYSELIKVELNDRPYLLAFAPISGVDWSLGLMAPLDEITAGTATTSAKITQIAVDTKTLGLLASLAAVLLLGLAMSYVLRRQFVRPLTTLSSATRAIAEGNLQPIAISSDDEIGQLARSFNSMSAALGASRAELTARGGIVLLDFGLAKRAIGTHASALSGASIFGYTPQYAPLEQICATGTDERSDLYALAATLYHLLAGTPPPDVLERASALICAQPDPLRPINMSDLPIPADFAAPLMRALALDPAQRPACAIDLRTALAGAHPDQEGSDHTLPARAPTALTHTPEAVPVTIVEPAIPKT